EDKTLQMSLNDDGVPTKAVAETTNHTVDVAVQATKTVASLLVKASPLGASFKSLAIAPTISSQTDPALAELEDINAFFSESKKKDCLDDKLKKELDALNTAIAELKKAEVNSVRKSAEAEAASAEAAATPKKNKDDAKKAAANAAANAASEQENKKNVVKDFAD